MFGITSLALGYDHFFGASGGGLGGFYQVRSLHYTLSFLHLRVGICSAGGEINSDFPR
jgi:hypothetical protein